MKKKSVYKVGDVVQANVFGVKISGEITNVFGDFICSYCVELPLDVQKGGLINTKYVLVYHSEIL